MTAAKNILHFGNPLLRQIAQPVTLPDPEIAELLDEMAETLYAAEGRAGLAAPQVGVLKQVIVIDCGDGLIELLNPEILELRGEQSGPEACLSFPGYTGLVKRAQYVKIQYQNRMGQTLFLEGEDFLARCIQHEIDHLSGILYIDHLQENELYLDLTQQKVSLLEILRLSKQGQPFQG
jgi:peptide deformylase